MKAFVSFSSGKESREVEVDSLQGLLTLTLRFKRPIIIHTRQKEGFDLNIEVYDDCRE